MNEKCYEIKDKSGIILIDQGTKIPDPGMKVSYILLTHGHFDHVLGICGIINKAPLVIHEGDAGMLENDEMNLSKYMVSPVKFHPDIVLKGSSGTIGGLRFIHTPGHTPGSVCYYLKGENILFTGDLMFRDSIGRTDFPGGDIKASIKSVDAILSIFDDDTLIYPGHGDETSIKEFKTYWRKISKF